MSSDEGLNAYGAVTLTMAPPVLRMTRPTSRET